MRAGRKPEGANLVEKLEGSDRAKAKLREILRTLAGEETIAEACDRLGIGPSMFHKLRQRTLQEMVESLEPRAPGPAAEEPDVGALEDQIGTLGNELRRMQQELAKSRVREELARWRVVGGKKAERKRNR